MKELLRGSHLILGLMPISLVVYFLISTMKKSSEIIKKSGGDWLVY
jgi:hypothetical protein